jgi:WD40 repeat protein
MCVQTFYGHNNAVNGVAFNTTGDLIASCDADGIVKLWDVRAISERATLDCGDRAVNKVRCRLSADWCCCCVLRIDRSYSPSPSGLFRQKREGPCGC